MAQKSYIFTRDFKSPMVVATGLAHNPQSIKFKRFNKGQIVRGELKHANNKPAFLLVNGVCVVPLDVIKELVTKAVVSSVDGNAGSTEPKVQKIKVPTNPKVRYADAVILGALVGVIGVYVAEKQGWISEPDRKYKLYGALGGAALAAYIVYRTNNAKSKVQIVKTTQD
jgi:hypothetical protein